MAAASGTTILQEQLERQEKEFVPPHPEDAMREEEVIRSRQPLPHAKEIAVNGTH